METKENLRIHWKTIGKPKGNQENYTETKENIKIHRTTVGKPYGNHRKTIEESLETVGTRSILNGPPGSKQT